MPVQKSEPSDFGAPNRRVLLVGWGSADWAIIDPLLEAGRMPALAGLIARGVRGNVTPRAPLNCTALWTGIATGKRAHKHRVLNAREPRRDGRGTKPVSPSTRTCKAVWNLLAERGLRCRVVAWPATHPAEHLPGGVTVSDAHAPARSGTAGPPAFGDTIWPEEWARRLAPLAVHPRDIGVQTLTQLVPAAAVATVLDHRRNPRLRACARSLAESATVHAAATELVADAGAWDFAAVCYEGLDRISSRFIKFRTPADADVAPADVETYGRVVDETYVFHDMMLGRLVELAGPDATIVLVSDHGDRRGARRGAGIAVLAGPGIRRQSGAVAPALAMFDVTPTLLALFGLPRGRDMDGRPWAAALDAPVEALDEILSWESSGEQADGPDDAPDDAYERASEDSIARLLQLGYAEPRDPQAHAEARQSARANALALAQSLIDARQPAAAAEVLEPIATAAPQTTGPADDLLAEAYFRAGRLADAGALIDRIIACRGGREDLPLAHLGRAALDISDGKIASAAEHLAQAEQQISGGARDPAGSFVLVGRLYRQMGRLENAARTFTRAAEFDPEHAEAFECLSAASLALGDVEAALANARRAVELAPDAAGAHYQLARAILRNPAGGDPREAEAALLASLRCRPDAVGPHRELAALYAGPLYDPRRQRHHLARVQEILLARGPGANWDDADD